MYNKELLCRILTNLEFKAVNDDGKVLPPSDPMYVKIRDAMLSEGSSISPKHVYTILKGNRFGIYDIVLSTFNTTEKIRFDDSKDTDFNISNRSVSSSPTKKRFRIVLSAKEWADIQPNVQIYGTRKYDIVKPGVWTHMFAKKL